MHPVSDHESIDLNCSKSIQIRSLIAGFLYHGKIEDVSSEDSSDAHVVHDALVRIRHATLLPSPSPVAISAEDCGAAYRFLAAVLSIMPGKWILTGQKRLLNRPIQSLIDVLIQTGAHIVSCPQGWLIEGRPLHARKLSVDCSQSSQFASALLLIGPKIGLEELDISPTPTPSQAYIDMTRQVLSAVCAEKPVPAEGDWSTAAFWYAYLALSRSINSLQLNLLKMDSVQGDCIIARWMEDWGLVRSIQKSNGIVIERLGAASVPDIELDMHDHPDLVPVLVALAAAYPFRLTMHNVGTLNLKESRRLDHLADAIGTLCECQVIGDKLLYINGMNRFLVKNFSPLFEVHNDHRLVMAYQLLRLQFGIRISEMAPVAKSYPAFLKYFCEEHT
ncbi:MAG: hypothetical protein J5642_03350 [Bacteroidales bacterium]|nr:hypothetical protein [Bacteroidales bacterium]